MNVHGYEEPVFIISVASDLLKMHPQTLRMYEREGLVVPKRTGSSQRLYSQKDLDDIKEIRVLTREKGVNLAGVRIILELRRQIDKLKESIDGTGENS